MSVEVDSQYGSMLAEKEESGRERWVQTAANKYGQRNMSFTYVVLVTNFGWQRACVLLHTET